MSLRKQAKIIGVNAGHLSRMVSGKRPWNAEVKARYEALVGNTSGNTSTQITENGDYGFVATAGTMVELGRFELPTSSMPLKRSPR